MPIAAQQLMTAAAIRSPRCSPWCRSKVKMTGPYAVFSAKVSTASPAAAQMAHTPTIRQFLATRRSVNDSATATGEWVST